MIEAAVFILWAFAFGIIAKVDNIEKKMDQSQPEKVASINAERK